jgi:hypothetical protein
VVLGKCAAVIVCKYTATNTSARRLHLHAEHLVERGGDVEDGVHTMAERNSPPTVSGADQPLTAVMMRPRRDDDDWFGKNKLCYISTYTHTYIPQEFIEVK